MKHLAQILKDRFGVREEDYNDALHIKNEKGGYVGDILVEKKIVTEEQLLESFSILYDIPLFLELPLDIIKSDLVKGIPIQFLKKHTMVPLGGNGHGDENKGDFGENGEPEKIPGMIAINNPACFQPLDDLVRLLNIHEYKVVFSTKNAILSAINISYEYSRDSAEQLVQDMEDDGSMIISDIEETADLLDDTSDAPIIKLVNHIISQSIKARASDIHIEPYQNILKVRYRVDGILYDLVSPPKAIQSALISRIKVMARLNIAEKRLPQDGRIEVKKGDQNIDIRVSTVPTSFGERVVLRLLNKTSSMLNLTELGMEPDRLRIFEDLIRSANGIVLVTGPTGSGKTTTLYAALSSINKSDINIITIEDPVEYQIQGIGQIQVNQKIGLTFAQGLRSIVRQDPDVILIGEIRDRETAEIAVQSALTGHLVFSTLHTNDSASAITRLVDIGIEPFLLSSSVLSVIAQRLVRVLCDDCKIPYTPDDYAMQSISMTADQLKGRTVYKKKGCENCFQTGYSGRVSIFEIMLLDDNLRKTILETYDSNQIKNVAVKQNMTTLLDDGIKKVLEGKTSISEILRVTQ